MKDEPLNLFGALIFIFKRLFYFFVHLDAMANLVWCLNETPAIVKELHGPPILSILDLMFIFFVFFFQQGHFQTRDIKGKADITGDFN